MSERESYPHGVPCWVDALVPDPEAALSFYGDLFGWEFDGPGKMPGEPSSRYFVARRNGRDIAGIGMQPSGAPQPSWSTHIRADSADAAAEAAKQAGGTVVVEPFDVPPVGRMAVLDDPAGARFVAWEADGREGAQTVNEPGAWAMSALRTADPNRARDFYGSVFGWEAEEFAPGVSLLRLPGFVGGEPEQPVPRDVIATMMRVEDPAAEWRPDFWIADVDAAAAKTTELGGTVIEAPADVPRIPFRSTLLADADGAVFSLSQLVAAGSMAA